MMGCTHRLSGAVVWLAGAAALDTIVTVNPVATWMGAILAAAGALGPDIDHPRSTISRSCGWLSRGISAGVHAVAGHRGATHWGITALGVGLTVGTAITLIIPAWWWAGLAIGVGWLVHICGDACTVAGVPLLGPWRTGPIGVPSMLRIRTGHGTERWLVRPALVVSGVAAMWSLL